MKNDLTYIAGLFTMMRVCTAPESLRSIPGKMTAGRTEKKNAVTKMLGSVRKECEDIVDSIEGGIECTKILFSFPHKVAKGGIRQLVRA